MKDRRIVDSWNKVKPDNAADTRMLNTILARKRELYKKEERRNAYLICLTQIAMFTMTLSIVVITFIFCPGIVRILLISYVLVGGLISVTVVLLHSSNNKIMKEGRIYD